MVVGVLSFVHHIDHIARADHIGWPLSSGAPAFTASLAVYPIVFTSLFLLRQRPFSRVALCALLVVILHVPHMFLEPPGDQYGTWAEGTSSVPHALGRPTLLGISSPWLGILSVGLSVLLSGAALVALVLLSREVEKLRRTCHSAAWTLVVLWVVSGVLYAWAVVSTDTSQLARTIAWQEPDVLDHQRFPSRTIEAHRPTFRFPQVRGPGGGDPSVEMIRVHDGADVIEHPFEDFLRSTQTTAFLVVKGGSLVYEEYFNGYRRDSTFTSFSVAKSFVSTLIGIAIDEGAIDSVDDPVTKYVPELAQRDRSFDRITLRHLLTMSSGLRDQDLYYEVDIRDEVLEGAEVERPPGQRFDYNNVNAQLLGIVIERASGRSLSTYLEEKLWGRIGMEANGSWSLDSEQSGFELTQAGLNGRAIDFAKFGALYLNGGSWRGRQVVSEDWVRESTRADDDTDPSADYQYFWWTRPTSGARNEFWAQGNHGQFIYLAPEQDVVLVRFGIEYGYDYWPELLARLARSEWGESD